MIAVPIVNSSRWIRSVVSSCNMVPKLIVTGCLMLFVIEYINCDCTPPPPPPSPPPCDPPSNPPGAPAPNPPGTPAPNPSGAPAPNPPGTLAPNPPGVSTPNPSGTPAPNPPGTPVPNPPGAPAPNPSGAPTPATSSPNSIPSSSYPNPRRDEKVQDTYGNNVVIKDPYRWMENPDCPETKKFVDEEMAITKPYLEKSPFRSELQARYKELENYAKFHGLTQKGKYFYSYQNTGLQNQDVLFIQDSLKGEPKVFLDPNTLSKDGTVALNGCSDFSDDGLVFGYLTCASGSDWETLQFKHVEKGDIYKEKLTKLKFSDINFTPDGKGVFYEAFMDQKGKADGSENDECKNHRLYYHELGTEQCKDIMVAEFPENPDYFITARKSDCGKYLILLVSEGCDNNLVYIADMDKIKWQIKGKLELIPIVTKMEANYYYVTNTDKALIFRTNKDSDNYRLISIDITNPDPKSWKDLVPEDKKNMLEWAKAAFEKYLVLCYTEDVKSIVQIHDIASGKMVKKLQLDIGTVEEDGFYGDKKYKDIFLNFESFLTPGIVYHVDLSNPSFDLEVYKEIKLPNFDKEKYTVEQVFFKSKDGTKIPMYVVHKKGLQKTGNSFTFMTAYGGFSISWLPYFAVNRLVVISNFDGFHAVPNIRGGGEYGEKWHKDGSLDKKQHSFDDFQAAAEFLIAEKYTNNKLLAINGGSNGGLLMGACLNQRPDLFGAVISDVGVYDMLRFDKFTCGHAWITEYGSASKPKDFEYLIKYSPLQNIKLPCEPGKQYPPTMLLTSDHDDRVSPLHSLKFIAELQFQAKSHPNQTNPLILRVEKDAGHGCTSPTDKVIEETVDMMCFIVLSTGIKYHP